ncbi:EamA family transporter [Streptomyces europaeiscabiei]|uniref:EamA family transporter n=1 Tax=Streptomyces europaeiscabiei TaxID=146819 RepID=UPI0029AD0A4F|nr:EamA family transporter [Streptomyces europaeiscabiei]MDX3697228.1 EamA family transporter [Streptomyces europaeiscabiei]
MGEFLALLSALCFGITHFVSGLLSRRADGMTVALHAQLGGSALALVLAPTLPGGFASFADYGWGALSGVGTGVGVAFLYRAMSQGAMSVVVPVSDLGAVALPVLAGVILLGERLSAPVWVGMAAVLPALWLVSQHTPATARERRGAMSDGVPSALVAGVGIALQFLAMAQVDGESGLWPVGVSRVVSVVVIAGLLVPRGSRWAMPPGAWAVAVAAGMVGTAAIVLYLEATTRQLMAVATVLSSLYPAVPVVLALLLLGERLNRRQVLGLLCAALAIALIALR